MNSISPNNISIPRYIPEFQQIIATKNYNFVGRDFVFLAIAHFLNQCDRGYFTIIGDPGIGKSAILAHYVSQNPGIVYYNVEVPGKNNTKEFFSNICTQLIQIVQKQDDQNIAENFTSSILAKTDFLSLLLQRVSDKLNPEERLIITIDGCDRLEVDNLTPGANIFYLPRYLPENVYFILTRRPFLSHKSGLLIETPSQSLDLSHYDAQNRSDIQEYMSRYLGDHEINYNSATQISQDETNFMYVSGILTDGDGDIYPKSLQGYYQNHLEKMILTTREQGEMALDVLSILVQEESISTEVVAERLDVDEYEIKVILDKWREFLHLESRESRIYYSFYHANFHDWLRAQRA
jgi:hypothetical protein